MIQESTRRWPYWATWTTGKVREIPVRHDLLEFLNAYLEVSGWRDSEPSSPLFRTTFRTTVWRRKRLT